MTLLSVRVEWGASGEGHRGLVGEGGCTGSELKMGSFVMSSPVSNSSSSSEPFR